MDAVFQPVLAISLDASLRPLYKLETSCNFHPSLTLERGHIRFEHPGEVYLFADRLQFFQENERFVGKLNSLMQSQQ